MSKKIAGAVRAIIEPAVTELGYDLVDVEYRREAMGYVLTVYIDKRGGVTLDDCERVYLRLAIDHDRIRFAYSRDGELWSAVGWEHDASILADEHAVPCGFTGNFVGIACQDISGRRLHADFDWFEYRELGDAAESGTK